MILAALSGRGIKQKLFNSLTPCSFRLTLYALRFTLKKAHFQWAFLRWHISCKSVVV